MTCKTLIIGLAAALAIAARAQAQVGPGFDLTWSTIDCGGGTSAGGSFSLSGTIGQPDAAPPSTSTMFSISGGYWPAKHPSCCLGDANGDKESNFADITAVLANWGAVGPSCIPGDADRSGAVNFTDITAVLSNWGAICL